MRLTVPLMVTVWLALTGVATGTWPPVPGTCSTMSVAPAGSWAYRCWPSCSVARCCKPFGP